MMKKLKLLCLIIFCPLLVFPQSYNEGYINYLDYQTYIDDLAVVTPTDTTPPDTFDTAPQLAFTKTDSVTFTVNPSEIEATDVDSILFKFYAGDYFLYLNPTNASGTASFSLPWERFVADSDTVIERWMLYYYKNNATYIELTCGDTSLTLYAVIGLKDEVGNTAWNDTITTTAECYQDNPPTIDTLWADDDSLYFKFSSGFTFENPNSISTRRCYVCFFGNGITETDTTLEFSWDGGIYFGSTVLADYDNPPTSANIFSSAGIKIDSLVPIDYDHFSILRSAISADDGDSLFLGTVLWLQGTTGTYRMGYNSEVDFSADTIIFFSSVTTLSADINGVDSVDVTARGYSTYTDSTFAFADTTQRIPSKALMAGGIADTSVVDSLNSWKFLHGLTDGGFIYIYLGGQDAVGNLVWDSTFIYMEDINPPLAGTLDYFNFVPSYNDTFSVTKSATVDAATFYIHFKKRAIDGWSLLYTGANADFDSSFSLVDKLSFVGSDTQFIRLLWTDNFGQNSDPVYDTLFPTPSAHIYLMKGNYDSTHVVLDSLKIGISASSIASAADWGMKVDFADTLTTLTLDTLSFDIPDTLITQHPVTSSPDTVYVWTIIKWTSNWSSDTSAVAKYYEHFIDTTPPDSATTFALVGDALGKDTLRFTCDNLPQDATNFIYAYKDASAMSTIADSTGSWAWAIADSNTYKTFGRSIDWATDHTVYGYLYAKDASNNWQSVAQANHDICTVDSNAVIPVLPTNFVVSADIEDTGDSAQVAATKFGTGTTRADTIRIQYNAAHTNSYPTAHGNGTNLWAGADEDSAQINNDWKTGLSITRPDCVYFSIFTGLEGIWNEIGKDDTANYKSAGTEEYLDVENATVVGSNYYLLVNARGQSFQVPNAGTITGIGFYCLNAFGTHDITCRIGTSYNLTSSYKAADAAISVTTSATWYKFVFSDPLTVTTSTTYYLGFVEATSSNEIGTVYSSATYANGGICGANSGWNMQSPNPDIDIAFRVYVTR